MRRSHTDQATSSAEVNLTPLIDMVFILLIFFIVTSSFVKESGIEVNRPSAKTAERQERANIIIAANNKGEVWIDKRKVDIHTVRSHIERLRAENPEGSVVILADEKSQTGVMVQIMDQVRLAGVTNVSIAATTTSGSE
ncbi:MAG: ExbD/TolR family protein [Gammaproteobacteria bacterium]